MNTQLKELVKFSFDVRDFFQKAKENDGVVDAKDFFMDIKGVLALLEEGKVAVEGLDKVPSEWTNSTKEEREALVNEFADRFTLENKEREAQIEAAIQVAVFLLGMFVKPKA